MEESELMKERLQAITEKHRIQKEIRQKKQELDRERLKLKHLKKKSLREQWLLDSSYHPPGSTASEQQTRALLLSIYSVEKEIEALEREEAIVSKNEGFILERLKAVERSTEDIIKEANESFVSDPPHVALETPDFPQSFSPTTSDSLEPEERKTLFALEINVNKNRRTGHSAVLSTSSISPDHLEERPGLKVYDDGRKCVYAVHSLEGSDDQSSVSELSASEVEQLLRSATVHRQMTQPHANALRQRSYYHDPPQNHSIYNRGLSSGRLSPGRLSPGRLSPAPLSPRPLSPGRLEDEVCWRAPDRARNGHSQNKRIQRGTSFKVPQNNNRHTQQLRRHQSFQSNRYSSPRNNHANHGYRCPSPRSHLLSSYTPSSDIPLSDYICVDEEEELFHTKMSPAPSPVFGEDTPFTILNAMETGEPITAIFMGFQQAPDDSGRGQEYKGALRAELVIIDDNYGKEMRADGEVEPDEGVGGAKEQAGLRRVREKGCCTLS